MSAEYSARARAYGAPTVGAYGKAFRRRLKPALPIAAGLIAFVLAFGAPHDERQNVRQIHDRIAAHPSVKSGSYKVTIPNTAISYEMVPIPAGNFILGPPTHKVHLDAFWMQAHEVTWDEYRLFMFPAQAGETDHKDATVDAVSRPTRPYVEMSFGMGLDGYPAISMTQHAASKYAEWLSAKTGEFYRLPTEAEWEYACRANASEPDPLGDYAWYATNSQGKYQKAGTKKPNAWGLYDMLGNVMEWTLDQYAPYRTVSEANPWVRATKPYPHAVRGGSWNDPASTVNCTARVASDPSWKQQDPQLPKSIWYHTDAQWLGFRLVRPARVPTADEMYDYWNSGVEQDEAALHPKLYQAAEPHMGTLVSIKLYAGNREQAGRAFRVAFDRIAQLDDTLSDYKSGTELCRITREAVRRPVRISEDLFRVLDMGQRIARETDGAFDLTLGPLTHLWREARKLGSLPAQNVIEIARQRCGYQKMHLAAAARTVRFDEPDMLLDVGAIGKGYAAEEALASLTRLGIQRALVAVSGDLAMSGGPWKIGFGEQAGSVALSDAAVSTSGDSEQHLDVRGQRYSHIVNPASGYGLTAHTRVSVIARSGMEADALATAISVLGPAKAYRLVAQHPGSAFKLYEERGIHRLVTWNEAPLGDVFQSIFMQPSTERFGDLHIVQ